MKLIKVVRLARVKYEDMDRGDKYCFHGEYPTKGFGDPGLPDGVYCPTDTTKYPPESVTYTIEGIPGGDISIVKNGAPYVVIEYNGPTWFDESDIEVRYV